jgi:cob(I)alamin adenosyltransferase
MTGWRKKQITSMIAMKEVAMQELDDEEEMFAVDKDLFEHQMRVAIVKSIQELTESVNVLRARVDRIEKNARQN